MIEHLITIGTKQIKCAEFVCDIPKDYVARFFFGVLIAMCKDKPAVVFDIKEKRWQEIWPSATIAPVMVDEKRTYDNER